MYEEKGGSLTHNAHFGIDPLALRPDLVESREKLFSANQPTGPIIFSGIVHGNSELFEHALRFLIDLTMYLTRELEEYFHASADVIDIMAIKTRSLCETITMFARLTLNRVKPLLSSARSTASESNSSSVIWL